MAHCNLSADSQIYFIHFIHGSGKAIKVTLAFNSTSAAFETGESRYVELKKPTRFYRCLLDVI